MNEIMDVSFAQEPVEEAAAEPVHKSKKKKAAADPEVAPAVMEKIVAAEPKTNMREGVVVYTNQYVGAIGVEADGVGYQMPNKFDCHVGDHVTFALVEGRPVLQC